MIDFSNSRILVTGACGTVGRQLIQLLHEDYEVGEILGIDNNESELFFLEERFGKNKHNKFFVGDIRDRDKITRIMRGIDVAFHTAAFKHVALCERSPFEAVQTNILGVQNFILASLENNVSRAIFTSSDKAVNPTNVMGTSKLMGERLMTAANANLRERGPVFASTRFGNVLGSRGSVVPIFNEQIKKGGPITLTAPEMTRFIMSIRDAAKLVIDSASLAKGGEIFITKMPAIRIQDLAEAMKSILAPGYGYSQEEISTHVIGVKPGEKTYEELMSEEERRRALEIQKYFIILPAFRNLYTDIEYIYPNIISDSVPRAYNSKNEELMNTENLIDFLNSHLAFDI